MKYFWRGVWLLLAVLLLPLTIALAAGIAETEEPDLYILEQTASQELPQVTGLRMLTATETVTVNSFNEGQITRTLYPGSLVWTPVEGDVFYEIQYYRVSESDEAERIGVIDTDDAFLPIDLLWTPLGKGIYYATVSAISNSAEYIPSDPVESNRWTLNATPSALPVPTLTVNGSSATVSGNAENVARYNFQILARESQEVLLTVLLECSDPTFSIGKDLVEDYPNTAFSVRAQAVALDPTQNTNSDWSASVPIATPEKLPTPTNVHFITTPTTIEVDLGNGASYQKTLYPGAIVWDPVDGVENYSIEFYRDGEVYQNYSTVSNFCDQWWYPWEQLPSGTYIAQVQSVCYDGTMLPSEVVEAGPWVYTQPDTKLQKPANLRWEGTKAVIDPVENAENYYFILYYSATADGSFTKFPAHYLVQSCAYEFAEQIQELGNGYYYFQAVAFCNDVTVAVTSPMSDASGTVHIDWEKLSAPQNFRVAQEKKTVEYTYNGQTREVEVCPGFLAWDPVDGSSNYLLTFYPAGEEYAVFSYYANEPCWSAFYEGLLEPGMSYDITLEALGTAGESIASDKAMLQNWTYEVPEEKLPAPTVTQEGYSISIVEPTPNAVYGYQVEILSGANRETATLCHMESITADTFEIPAYIKTELDGTENYYIRMLARSNNLLAMADSDWTQLVWLVEPESVKETISQVEQIRMGLSDEAELSNVQTELLKIGPDKLQTALEEKPVETAAQIVVLEKQVGAKVTVTGAADAQVIGLGLSAYDTTEDVTLTVTQTPHAGLQLQAAPEISGENFKRATDVRFEAENVTEQLVVPILVSLPAPDGDPEQLRLYQGSELEEVPFTLVEGNMCFAVSNLDQTYVLAEANLLGEVTVSDETVTVTVNAPGTTLYAASYDANGKMLDVVTASVTADQTSYSLQLTPGAFVQAFLLDENLRPLCQAKTIDNQS